jgi:hypothetical protein
MRTLFVAALLFFSVSCTEEEIKAFKDTAGTWTFEGSDVSGTFKVHFSETDSKFYINEGTFRIKDQNYTIGYQTAVLLTGLNVDQIALKESDTGDFIEFYYAGSISDDFKSMTFTKYRYLQNNDIVEVIEDVVATRK